MDSKQVEKTSGSIDDVMASMNLSEAQKKALKSAIKSEGRSRRMSVTEIEAKYPHVIKGSLRFDAVRNKQQVTITCSDPSGKGCEATREVYTSDLFQVDSCEGCKSASRKKARDEQKQLLADFKAKQAEASKTKTEEVEAEEAVAEAEAEQA